MTLGGLRGLGERVFTWAVSKRARIFLLVAIVAIGMFGTMHTASAGPWEDAKNSLFGMVGEFLGFVIDFMGRLVILLTNVLIEFASYNNFVNSAPVTIGWVLVRDVVNMFFIVILLVSAFSTIIGYSEFHYSKVLPKLLLMAVLINFSKTLIGLLIDFSQVLMLTFVNAFKPAAGGNFISLLKLNQVTQLDDKLTGLNSQTFGELIIATMLGIMMLGITITILVIMVAFMIYRIIALWMLLILSPMAFFALALPGKLAKGMSAFTSKFWDRLSNLLIAGPVMAFFLWLALAIAQGNQGFSDLYARQSSEVEGATAQFVSSVGNAQSIATFIVAVAFLLSGLEFAVSTANALSPTLGKFAAGVSAGGGAVPQAARLAARLTGRGARIAGKGVRVAGKVTGAVAGGAFEGIDRFADLRGKIGRAGLRLAPEGVGAATFAGLATYKGRKVREKQAQLEKMTAGLDPATRDAFLRSRTDSKLFGKEAMAAKISLAENAGTLPGLKGRAKLIEEQVRRENPNLSPEELNALTEARAQQQAALDIQAGRETAERIGDDGKMTKFKETLEKSPHLNTDWKALASIKGESVEDPKRYLEKVSTASMKDGRTAIAHMKALGLVDDQGNFVRNEANEATWELLKKGDRGKLVDAHVAAYEGRAGDVRAMLQAMDGNPEAVVQADAARHFASILNGNVGSVFVGSGAATRPPVVVEQEVNIRNEGAITEGAGRLQQFAAGNVAPTAPQAQEVQRNMLAAGATLAEAFQFNAASGEFANREQAQAFTQVMGQVAHDMAEGNEETRRQGLAYFRTLDTNALNANPNGFNEARTAMMENLNTEALRHGYEAAVRANDEAARERIVEMGNIVRKEADRVRNMTSGLNTQELQAVVADPNSRESVERIQRVMGAGAQTPERALAAVHATLLAQALEVDEGLRAMRGEIADAARQGAGRGAGAGAGAVRGRRGRNRGAAQGGNQGGQA
jgi:hypothetical protein